MPMYDYRCTNPKCQHEFEKRVTKYDTEAKAKCPKCGKISVFHMPMGPRKRIKFLFNYMAPDAE